MRTSHACKYKYFSKTIDFLEKYVIMYYDEMNMKDEEWLKGHSSFVVKRLSGGEFFYEEKH